MIGQILLINAALLFIYMTLWFTVAYKRQRIDTVDTAWGLGFVVAAWSAELQQPSGHSLAIAILVSIWGLRLANHIYQRAKNRDEDPRYVELRDKWRGNVWLRAYGSIFVLQGLIVWIVSLPVVTASGRQMVEWGWLTVLGAIVWAAGFTIESLADYQLTLYLRKKDRPKVLDTGIWRYSRHPNYFGELTQWWAIGIIASQVRYGWVGLIGPLVLSILIIFVSGIPPIERRRAKDPAYRVYQQRTSPLLPLPPQP